MHWTSSKFNIMSKLNNSKVMCLTLYPAPAFSSGRWLYIRWSKNPLVNIVASHIESSESGFNVGKYCC